MINETSSDSQRHKLRKYEDSRRMIQNKNIHMVRLDLMSWVLDTSPGVFGSYCDWLQAFRKKVKFEGNFTDDCCKLCDEQRMVDLFLLRFRHSPHILEVLVNSSSDGNLNLLNLAGICERIDRGEFTLVKEEPKDEETNERKFEAVGRKEKCAGKEINISNEDLMKISEETGYPFPLLTIRKRRGLLAEKPIYYPDHPDIPRYWTVDDYVSFGELLEKIPDESNPFKRARKIQELIVNGSGIPVNRIASRVANFYNAGNWTREENRKFLDLVAKYPADKFESKTERLNYIYEELGSARTMDAVQRHLSVHEMYMTSLRNPVVLPEYTEDQRKMVDIVGTKRPLARKQKKVDLNFKLPPFEELKIKQEKLEEEDYNKVQAEISDSITAKRILDIESSFNEADHKANETQVNESTTQLDDTISQGTKNDTSEVESSIDLTQDIAETKTRSDYFLKRRQTAGKLAEHPIYYPDYPNVPRYWTVDDMWAFDNLIEEVPDYEDENDPYKKAEIIQALIQSGESIPVVDIHKRCTGRVNGRKWTKEERKRFVELSEKFGTGSMADRARLIHKELDTNRPERAVLRHLELYEMCQESVRKPLMLPKNQDQNQQFGLNETSGAEDSMADESWTSWKHNSISHGIKRKIDKNGSEEGKKLETVEPKYKRRKSNGNEEKDLEDLSLKTGRSLSFLYLRQRAGKVAENPIYYPDHPQVPRYWTVDDLWAFDDLLEQVPQCGDDPKRARNIQGLIKNGESISINVISKRVQGHNNSWTKEERKKFLGLLKKHPVGQYNSTKERSRILFEAFGGKRTIGDIRAQMDRYEISMESIRKPLVLPKFGKSMQHSASSTDEDSESSFSLEGSKLSASSTDEDPENTFTIEANNNNNDIADIIEISDEENTTKSKINSGKKLTEDELKELAELSRKTGRSIQFLMHKKRAGDVADSPVFYPNHPDIPRYWTVDDREAFDDLLERFPPKYGIEERVRKIHDTLKPEFSANVIKQRILRIERTPFCWTKDEKRVFRELCAEHKAGRLSAIKRVNVIFEGFKRQGFKRSIDAVQKRLKLYDLEEESLEYARTHL